MMSSPDTPVLLSSSARYVLSRLTPLWEAALATESVGLDENFFDVGGSSLAAMSLMTKINREFQIELPVMAIFESSSLTRMVDLIVTELTASGRATTGDSDAVLATSATPQRS